MQIMRLEHIRPNDQHSVNSNRVALKPVPEQRTNEGQHCLVDHTTINIIIYIIYIINYIAYCDQ